MSHRETQKNEGKLRNFFFLLHFNHYVAIQDPYYGIFLHWSDCNYFWGISWFRWGDISIITGICPPEWGAPPECRILYKHQKIRFDTCPGALLFCAYSKTFNLHFLKKLQTCANIFRFYAASHRFFLFPKWRTFVSDHLYLVNARFFPPSMIFLKHINLLYLWLWHNA